MKLTNKSTKDIGNIGESVACEYLRRHGFRVVVQNLVRKIGEIDIVARKKDTLHFVEVKARLCLEFPKEAGGEVYDPSANLHPQKVARVARLAEWYVAEKEWEGDWQVDGILVWLRERDGMGKVTYLPQIV